MAAMAMDDLSERIRTSIEDPSGELWFPELTADLAAREWESLYRDIGLTPESYSTERVLSRSILGPREIITSLKACPCTCATASAILIEAFTPSGAAQYQDQGVTFYSPHEILQSTVLSCVEEALTVINQVPSLMRTVATLVRSLHVIRPVDDDCDVSFSEPHVPFSIFVSVPQKRITNDVMRVAEAIVHEAMHLQLTLIERVVPFFGSMNEEYFSPWRGRFRHSQGVLHAVYVFRVIDRFFYELLACPPLFLSSEFMGGRRREIGEQIRAVESIQWSQDLTHLGKCLVGKLLCRSAFFKSSRASQ